MITCKCIAESERVSLRVLFVVNCGTVRSVMCVVLETGWIQMFKPRNVTAAHAERGSGWVLSRC